MSKFKILIISGLILSFGLAFSMEEPTQEDLNKKLIIAANVGSLNTIKKTLNDGANVNTKNNKGLSVLMIAVIKRHLEIVKELINRKADISATNNENQTALMYAVSPTPLFYKVPMENNLAILETLINAAKYNKIAYVNVKDIKNRTALMYAIKKGNLDIIKKLIDFGANVNIKDNDNQTPLILATIEGDLEILRALIKAKVEDINSKNNAGFTALIIAALKGNLKIVKELIQAHANVDLQNNLGMNALMYASREGNLQIVKELIKAGANVNAKNITEQTALMLAVGVGSLEIVREFLKVGVDVNLVDNLNLSALQHAVNTNNLKIAKMLAAAGSDIDDSIRGKNPKLYDTLKNIKTNWPILVDAVKRGYLGQVQKIAPLMRVTLIIPINNHGDTLLHDAISRHRDAINERAKKDYLEIIKELIAAYPNLISIKNARGLDAVKYATAANPEILEYLTKLGF